MALLIGIRGHATDGDCHGECFDYFIPATDRAYELEETFIIDGVGHDLYARSWERMEKSVTLDEMTFVLANATILYAKSKEDEERFLALQKKLAELGKYLGVLAIVACVIIFAVGIANGTPVMEVFMIAVSLAVSAITCLTFLSGSII